MIRCLWVHGWAFGPSVFDLMVKELEKRESAWRWEFVDFGFWGEGRIPSGHFDLAVGHSLGLNWLLDQDAVTFDRIVSLAGFTRFTGDRTFRAGVHRRLVTRMQQDLLVCPAKLVDRFWEECGHSEIDFRWKLGNPDRERLNWGLEALKDWDRREQWGDLAVPVCRRLVVAATSDPIVSSELSAACFGGESIEWVESHSHLLPLAQPIQCASLIQNLMSN